ncbi:hypothetical protein PROFUN_15977 [Planoprotostelium fungivorum]|uniref:Uncharacterized protein n=1 Tax=Planoprotostelium fungivorum TaxID=1890364 RepID=A0A2P6MTX3_9EUKA|nr:hypothetical protein PROFUN_15977 [Planoprotostelium fungivorum]
MSNRFRRQEFRRMGWSNFSETDSGSLTVWNGPQRWVFLDNLPPRPVSSGPGSRPRPGSREWHVFISLRDTKWFTLAEKKNQAE